MAVRNLALGRRFYGGCQKCHFILFNAQKSKYGLIAVIASDRSARYVKAQYERQSEDD